MQIRALTVDNHRIALITSDIPLLNDEQSALDLIADVGYNYDCHKIALHQEAVNADFFKLSTGIAGAVVQKFVTYDCQLAIIGDFANYSSRALRDFIYESNMGRHLFFVPDEKAALEKLSR